MNKGGSVYILASSRHGTLYTGVTARLPQRMYEHREEIFAGFTSEYGVKRLVWVEHHETIESAIIREKRIKKWNREWKINMIEADNPVWDDLAVAMFGFDPIARHPREGGDPSPQYVVLMGPRLRGDDESS